MKENLNMMNAEQGIQNDGTKGLERKMQKKELSSGKRYPFYQMTLNW